MSTGTGSTPTTPTGDGLATAALVEQTPVPPTQSQGNNQGVGARVHPQAELLDAILASLYRGTGPENDEICELVVGNFQRLDLFLAATDEDFDRTLDDLVGSHRVGVSFLNRVPTTPRHDAAEEEGWVEQEAHKLKSEDKILLKGSEGRSYQSKPQK